MKIKTVKKMNLLELIQGVWKGDVKSGERKSDYGNTVFIWSQGLETYKGVRIQGDEVFTVEVDEELTEDTILPDVSFVYYASITEQVKTIIFSSEQMPTINGITGRFSSTLPLSIYYKDIPIWTSEHGIPESGVLEVSE